jgi:hypothetical protein
MKKFAILILLLNSSWAFAANNPANDIKEVITCSSVAEMAKMVMQLRQRQTPMAELYAGANGFDFMEAMIIRAYDKPAFQTESHQQRLVTEFADMYFMTCVKMDTIPVN